jgi:hypothetical protein
MPTIVSQIQQQERDRMEGILMAAQMVLSPPLLCPFSGYESHNFRLITLPNMCSFDKEEKARNSKIV